jgi:hypothetical protein
MTGANGQQIAYVTAMLLMIQDIAKTRYAKAETFALASIGGATGPAQIDRPIPAHPSPWSGFNGIVGMHQQNLHGSMIDGLADAAKLTPIADQRCIQNRL